MTTGHALLLSVVEGLTEFLPISSTGQMIIVSSLLGIANEQFVKDFTVIVQFGAILSVLVLYWRRFVVSTDIYLKLLVAFLPAAIIGLLVKKQIDVLLDNVAIVATTQIVGGIILLFVDQWFAKQEASLEATGGGKIESLDLKRAGFIGLVQCLAFIPGTSRSAASIIGGVGTKLTRKAAAEFSFLLAVPTLTAATAWKLLKIYKTIEPQQISILVISNIVAFVVAVITIKLFIGFLTQHGFRAFGIYRILVGGIILVLLLTGHHLEMM